MERRAQILQWLKDILDRNLSGMKFDAFVFGSQANKLLLGRSDIDLGIISAQPIPPLKIANIHADIEQLPMLFKIDVVDFYEADESFKKIALQNTEKL